MLQTSQNNPWALNLLAGAYRMAGDLKRARRAQELAVAVYPSDAGLWFNLARLAAATGGRDAAIRACDHALSLQPDHGAAGQLRAELARVAGT